MDFYYTPKSKRVWELIFFFLPWEEEKKQKKKCNSNLSALNGITQDVILSLFYRFMVMNLSKSCN